MSRDRDYGSPRRNKDKGVTFIIHSLVAFEDKILAACSSPIKQAAYDAQVCSLLSEKVLKKICARMTNHKKTYMTDKYHFHYIMEDGLVFMCVAQAAHGQRLPFNFLRDIRERWYQNYRIRDCMQARPYDMNDEFQKVLRQKMLYYSDDATDKLKEVLEKVDDVKGAMLSNVDKVLMRGDNLEKVATKAREVEEEGKSFKKSTIPLKRKKCLKNIKVTICLVCVLCCLVLLILYFVLYWVCGGLTLPTCRDKIYSGKYV
jgi:vesicle-associated membrane protein 7